MKRVFIACFLLLSTSSIMAQEFNRLFSFFAEGNCDSVNAYYQRFQSTFSEDSRAQTLLGICKIQNKQHSQAIPYLNKAILLDSNNLNARFNRATAYFFTNNFLFSSYDYEIYLKKAPQDSLAWYNKAMVHMELKEKKEALVCLNKAINHSSAYTEAYYQRHKLHKENEDYAKAVEDLIFCMEHSENSEYLTQELALVYYHMKDYQEALKQFESLQDTTDFMLEMIADCQYNLDKTWPAIETYGTLLKRRNSAKYYYNRALLYIKADRDGKAELDLNQAIKLGGNELTNYLHLRGICRYNQKKMEEACFDWDQASKLGHSASKELYEKQCRKD